eukprot:NODE_226_length_12301_cov_1.446648.p1 type:complete len:958 gc:universal NODE_226_length_12301_cov_1.446648:7771-10644(+)
MEGDQPQQPRVRKYGGLRDTPSLEQENKDSQSQPQQMPAGEKKKSLYGLRALTNDAENKNSAEMETSNQTSIEEDPAANQKKRLYGVTRISANDQPEVQDTVDIPEEEILESMQPQTAADFFSGSKKDDPSNIKKVFHKSVRPTKLKKKLTPEETMIGHLTFRRKAWMFFVALMTCWIPECCVKARIDSPEKRIAWREKVTLCLLMFCFSVGGVLWLEIKRFITCVDGDPKLNIRNPIHKNVFSTVSSSQVLIHGQLYSADSNGPLRYAAQYAGLEASSLFPRVFKAPYDQDLQSCVNMTIINRDTNYNQFISAYAQKRKYNLTKDVNGNYAGCKDPNGNPTSCYYGQAVDGDLSQSVLGSLLKTKDTLMNETDRMWFIIGDTVYDATEYVKTATEFDWDNPFIKPAGGPLDVYSRRFILNDDITVFLMNNFFTDATANFVNLQGYAGVQKCFDKLFFYGYVEPQNRFACWVLDIPFYSMSVVVLWVLYFRLITALLWYIITPRGYRKDAYVICFIPCYTEGPSMAVTLETLATADYQDEKKLLMVVCDGNITGKGNSKPTPEVALDLLGWKGEDPKPRAYLALGKADAKVNMAKVYSGFYEFQGHTVPYMVIAKVGKPSEKSTPKPGNRGKRDSQLILMNFYNKLTYKNRKMFPLEYEIYFHIKNIIKVDPLEYEYCLMVDADTKVDAGSLKHLIGPLIENPMVIAGCGETNVSNKYASYTSMIQIYEYWINHHYGKCFESFFGKVTCLPGCFCIYRMRYPRGEPFLCHDNIIKDYSINRTMTLHTKNLLHLGEDRYLTTLILKHFPTKRLIFLPMAICSTDIPDKFAVLKSQRRRWINSTFHNQYVLFNIPRICGRWCCDMKLLVMYELSSFLVMPAATLYLYSLVVRGALQGNCFSYRWRLYYYASWFSCIVRCSHGYYFCAKETVIFTVAVCLHRVLLSNSWSLSSGLQLLAL